jgi:fatty acid desaturase
MPSTDEIHELVAKLKQIRQRLPKAQQEARFSVWMARFSMLVALAVVAFNTVFLDLPALVVLAVFLSAGTFLHAAHTLIRAEARRLELQTIADETATDLEKAQALLEEASVLMKEKQ